MPSRGASVTVLETKAANGKSLEQRVAERAPGRDRVERPRGVDDRVRRARSRRSCMHATVLERSARLEHRAVDAQPDVAVARRHDAAEAGAEAARHPGLERELGGDVVLGAQRPHRLEHRRRPAGVAPLPPASAPRASSSVTSPWWPTEPSSVATRAPGSSAAPSACSASRKPEQGGRPRRARRSRSSAARCRPRRRTSTGRRPSRGGANPRPSGPTSQTSVAGRERAQPLGPGPDVLEHEVERRRRDGAARPRTRAAGTAARPRARPSRRPRRASRTARRPAPARPGRRPRARRRRRPRGGPSRAAGGGRTARRLTARPRRPPRWRGGSPAARARSASRRARRRSRAPPPSRPTSS